MSLANRTEKCEILRRKGEEGNINYKIGKKYVASV